MNKKQVYTLPRTGAPPLRFEGELVAEADTEAMESLRHYITQIYRVGTKWVTYVGYRTKWAGESDHDWARICRDVQEITQLLEEYNVLPEGRGYPPMAEYQDRQKKLRGFLQRDFDVCISELLDNEAFVETLDDTSSEYGATDLELLEAFVRRHLHDLELSHSEICAVCDANSGATLKPDAAGHIIPTLQVSDGLDEKWGVSTELICERLRGRNSSVMFALACGIAYYWRRTHLPEDEALRKAGFIWED